MVIKEFADIIYQNSRKARNTPHRISGDETITRLYTSKVTSIRMRTAKKNESGILNQNLCGSNEGYSTWQQGDYIGGGYTFCNIAYPGKTYSFGNIFRERDMGNHMLLFQCKDYFRYRNIELIADSHFGHFVPITFLKQWKILCTTSVLTSRKGISNIPQLSGKKLQSWEKRTWIGAG